MQIAARQSFLTGRAGPPLPYDAEVEYLHFPSGGYVDTDWSGFVTNAVTMSARLRITRFNAAHDTYFGNFGTDTAYAFLLRRNNQSNTQLTAYFSRNNYHNFNYTIGGMDELAFANGAFSVNGSAISTGHPGFTMDQSILIGASKADGSIIFASSEFDLAAFIGVDAQGNTVRDFIPVRVGSGSSAVGYLYDRANPTGGPLGNGLYGNAADGQGGVTGFAQFGADK